MIPAAFDYQRPASLDDGAGRARRPTATPRSSPAGMSLLPLMKLRLASAGDARRHRPAVGAQGRPARPPTAASSRRADDLRRGARRRPQLDFARGRDRRASATSRSATAARVGGAIAHADPAVGPAGARPGPRLLGWSCAPRAASGSCRSTGSSRAPFQTGIAPDELLVELRRGPLPDGRRRRVPKLEQPASGYSIVGVGRGRRVDRRLDQPCPGRRSPASARSPTGPRRSRPRSSARTGRAAPSPPRPSTPPTAQTVNSDIHADREYRTRMAVVYTRRAIEAALGRSRLTRDRPAHRVRVERVTPGRRAPGTPARARSSRATWTSAAQRWSKGRRLTDDDLRALGGGRPGAAGHRPHRRARRAARGRRRAPPREGGRRPGPGVRGPNQSRLDLRRRDAGRRQRRGSRSWSGSTGSTRSRSSPSSTARSSSAATSWPASRSRRTSSTRPSSRPGARIAGFGSQPIVWVAPFIAAPRRGRRQGIASARRPASGSRRASGRRSRASARRSSTSSTSRTTPTPSRRRSPGSPAGPTRPTSS